MNINIMVNGRPGVARVEDLIKIEIKLEDDNKIIETVEYCFKDCPADIHKVEGVKNERLNQIQSGKAPCFCDLHVHRSVGVKMKRWPEGMFAEQAVFGG